MVIQSKSENGLLNASLPGCVEVNGGGMERSGEEFDKIISLKHVGVD